MEMIGLAIYSTIIGFTYLVVQLWLRKSWKSLPEWHIPDSYLPSTTVVVIIPARNEAANIRQCLEAILNQDYPGDLFEVILIDDHSDDRTVEFARAIDDHRLKIIALEDYPEAPTRSPKKTALLMGIQDSSADLILTTDADCVANPIWISTVVSYYEQEQKDMIAGPVIFAPLESLFERFQALDFVGMMGITGAGIYSGLFHMCNGANLAFSRASFQKVGGYDGTDHIASGDDILLAQKYVQHPDLSIGYLKSNHAVVSTRPVKGISAFIAQRLRWGAKSEHYNEKRIIWVQFLVLITCLSLIAFGLLGIVFHEWHWKKYLLAFGILYAFKALADFIVLSTYSRYFNQRKLMRNFGYATLLHPLYIGIVGLLSVFVRKHEWKGRQLK